MENKKIIFIFPRYHSYLFRKAASEARKLQSKTTHKIIYKFHPSTALTTYIHFIIMNPSSINKIAIGKLDQKIIKDSILISYRSKFLENYSGLYKKIVFLDMYMQESILDKTVDLDIDLLDAITVSCDENLKKIMATVLEVN